MYNNSVFKIHYIIFNEKKYYEDEVYGDVSINHILITPDVKEDATEEETKKAEEKAKEKAEDLIKKLNEAKKNKEDVSKFINKLVEAKLLDN